MWYLHYKRSVNQRIGKENTNDTCFGLRRTIRGSPLSTPSVGAKVEGLVGWMLDGPNWAGSWVSEEISLSIKTHMRATSGSGNNRKKRWIEIHVVWYGHPHPRHLRHLQYLEQC